MCNPTRGTRSAAVAYGVLEGLRDTTVTIQDDEPATDDEPAFSTM